MEKYADVLDLAQAHMECETQLRISAIRKRCLTGKGRRTCLECGTSIPEARRTRVPNAQRCAPCEQEHEWLLLAIPRRA
jgi:phage/conjugal plasmid C-4 type zinc finger TraR family protein